MRQSRPSTGAAWSPAQGPAPPRSRRRARDRAVRPALRLPSCRWHRSRSPRHRRAGRSGRPCSPRPRRRTGTALITATSEGKSGGAAIAVGTPPPPAGCAPTGSGVCRYVDAVAGNDGNPGDSAHPFKTVQHAADVVNAGDMVIVRNGVYTGGSNAVLSVGRGGTATNWVVFKAENKWGAVLDGQNNRSADGVHLAASFVRIEGFEIKGVWHDAISPSSGVSDFQIAGNHI